MMVVPGEGVGSGSSDRGGVLESGEAEKVFDFSEEVIQMSAWWSVRINRRRAYKFFRR